MTAAEYETARIAKVTGKCPACEDYAEKNATNPPKIAVMACEGACARGEVARRAANLVAHRLATDSTVRICLGGAFTKDTGQRNLVRRADRVLAIEGCFINCSSRMMAGVLPELQPEIVRADLIHNLDLPFGIDEVPDEMFTIYAHRVAERVVHDYLTGSAPAASGTPGSCIAGAATPSCSCRETPPSCSAGSFACTPEPAARTNEGPCDTMTIRWQGATRFSAENPRGGSIVLADGTSACTPVEALMAALGSCANQAVLGQMQKRGTAPGTLRAEVTGTRSSKAPFAYERIHVTFFLATEFGDAEIAEIIRQAMTIYCPVAVTLGRATDLTWEFRQIPTE
jgi:uncharacterized OsmC-like protein/uncharacterized metal-binding protein